MKSSDSIEVLATVWRRTSINKLCESSIEGLAVDSTEESSSNISSMGEGVADTRRRGTAGSLKGLPV